MHTDPAHERIAAALRTGAATWQPAAAGADAARRRSRQRTLRRRAAGGALSAVVLAVGGVGLADALTPTTQVFLDDGSANGRDAMADLEWQSADGMVGSTRAVASDGSATFALSTAPGSRHADDAPPPQGVYRADDGWTFEHAGEGVPRLADLTAADGVVHGISTAPASGALAATGISRDGGVTWEESDLPTTAVPPDASVELSDPSVVARIAHGTDGLIAVVQTAWHVPAAALVDDDVDPDAAWIEGSPDGYEVIDCDDRPVVDAADDDVVDPRAPGRPADEPVRVGCDPDTADRMLVTWAELGLDGPGDLRTTEVFVSADGTNWTTEGWPGEPTDLLTDVTDSGAGAIVQVWRPDPDGMAGTRHVWTTTDGRDWTDVDVPGRDTRALFAHGRDLVAVTQDASPDALAVSADAGASWRPVDWQQVVAGAAPNTVQVIAGSTGPLGAALVLDGEGEPFAHGPVLATSSDTITWTATPLAEITAEPELHPNWVSVTADGVALTMGRPAPDADTPQDTIVFWGAPPR